MPESETRGELARLRAEHRQVSDLLGLIQELTSRAVRSDSASELFTRALAILLQIVPFDVAVAVMLEQNLDLHITTRRGAETLVNERLVAKIRATLEKLIPVSFATTEVVVRVELHELPPREIAGDGLQECASAIVKQGNRTAGLLLLFRAGPEFSDDERQVLTIFATQVSMLLDLIIAREKIANLADTDDLTGIWNKRYFRRQLPQEMERAKTFNIPLSLLFFDVDDFKQINDSFGHMIGDVVLSELCGAVKDMIRPTDVLARWGGDEFALILPHTDVDGARAIANRILALVRALTISTDEEAWVRCSVSIGIAVYEDDVSANDLIQRADEHLYLAKREGKNRYTA